MEKLKEVTVINWAGLNYGDNAIFEVLYELILKDKCSRIYLIANYPDAFNHLSGLRPSGKIFSIKNNFFNAFYILKSSLVICGGGDIIVGNINTTLLLFIARVLRKKTIIVGVGALPVPKGLIQWKHSLKKVLQKYALRGAGCICARDKQSANMIRQVVKNNTVHIFPDICFLLSLKWKRPPEEGVGHNKYFGVSIVPPAGMYENSWGQKEYDAFAQILDLFISKYNITPVFFIGVKSSDLALLNYTIPADDDIAKYIISRMRYGDKVEIFRDYSSVWDVLNMLKKMDFFVGMRLHFLISAAISNTPFVGLSYARKVNVIFSELGLNDLIIQWPLADDKSLLVLIEHIYQNKQAISDKISESMERQKPILEEFCELLKQSI